MLWTIGVFALNFGPVVVGPILDYVGPKLTAMFGKYRNMPMLLSLYCTTVACKPHVGPLYALLKLLAQHDAGSCLRGGINTTTR